MNIQYKFRKLLKVKGYSQQNDECCMKCVILIEQKDVRRKDWPLIWQNQDYDIQEEISRKAVS